MKNSSGRVRSTKKKFGSGRVAGTRQGLVTGDVKYLIFHAQSYTIGNFTDDAKYSVSKGATIPCHYPCHWCFQMLVSAIICHFTETERYSVGEREQGGKSQLSSKQINLIDDVWDDW